MNKTLRTRSLVHFVGREADDLHRGPKTRRNAKKQLSRQRRTFDRAVVVEGITHN